MLSRYLGILVVLAIAVGSAIVAVLCFRSVIDHTAGWNGDGGAFVFFGWVAAFMGTLLWIGLTRRGEKGRGQ